MDRKVYFGNASKQTWINAPQSGLQAVSNGFFDQKQLLNGRSFINRSYGSHREFNPTWIGSLNNSELEHSLQTIKDFNDGLYGDGPFYWIDPFASNQNIMAPHWAAPALTQRDWPAISDISPFESVTTTANLLNYPETSLRFAYADTDEFVSTKKFRVIIPQGYSLFFGWHGEITTGTGTIRIDRHRRNDGSIETLDTTPIAVTSSNRTNAIVSGDVYSMADIYFYKAADEEMDLIISAMIGQILRSTSYPETGGFISGRGTTGIEFSSPVSIQYYSSVINQGQVGLSTNWIEV